MLRNAVSCGQGGEWTGVLVSRMCIRVILHTLRFGQVGDLAAVAAFSQEHRLTSVIDATFATPVLLRPHAQLGFDVVIHSLTKYMNGHSDVLAGAVASSAAVIAKVGAGLRALRLGR